MKDNNNITSETMFRSIKKEANKQVFAFTHNNDILFLHTKTSTCDVTENENCCDVFGVTDKDGNIVNLSDAILSELYSKAIHFNVQMSL